MKRKLCMPARIAMATGIAACALALNASAEDLGNIKIGVDPALAARTNMPPRTADEAGTLGVSFDQDVANRTNMGRQPGDVGTVTTAPDMGLRARTNMGGIALEPQPQPAQAAAAQPAASGKTQ